MPLWCALVGGPFGALFICASYDTIRTTFKKAKRGAGDEEGARVGDLLSTEIREDSQEVVRGLFTKSGLAALLCWRTLQWR